MSDESAMYLCISKGDVATRSRCGRILNDLLHTNALLLGLDVKESLKIDQLLSKLRQEYSGTLLDNLMSPIYDNRKRNNDKLEALRQCIPPPRHVLNFGGDSDPHPYPDP